MKHNFDHVDINEMEELHGPLFKYSEFTVGQHITYSDEGKVYTGDILWIAAPQDIVGKHLPYHLIVNRDMPNGLTTWPDIVYRTDVLTGDDSQPTSTATNQPTATGERWDCPECGALHPSTVEECPQLTRQREYAVCRTYQSPMMKAPGFYYYHTGCWDDENEVDALASCNLSVDGHTEITGGFLRLVARRDLARNCTCSYCHKALSTYTEESEEAHHE